MRESLRRERDRRRWIEGERGRGREVFQLETKTEANHDDVNRNSEKKLSLKEKIMMKSNKPFATFHFILNF